MKAMLVQYKIPIFLFALWVGMATVYFLRAEGANALGLQVTGLQREISAMPEPPSHRSLKDMGVAFSWTHSVPDFLRELTTWSREHGLVVVSIEPGDSSLKDGYREQPVTLEVQGRYRSIGDFLSFLEGLPRPLQVKGLRVSRFSTASSDVSPHLLARLELVLYIKGGT